jgi:4-hydroxybenzoate polyprenyltransferase
MGLGYFYWLGMSAVAALLIYEHVLVKPQDLSRIDVAFFRVNSAISIVLFISVLGALI